MSRITDDLTVWRLTSRHCIVAADIDKTLLEQIKDQEEEFNLFKEQVGPALVETAQNGINVAFFTGNAMTELTNRILRYLIDELIHRNALDILDRFHFFCNSGGVYARFDVSDPKLAKIIRDKKKLASPSAVDQVLRILTIPGKAAYEQLIDPRFIDSNHVRRSEIPVDDQDQLFKILQEEASIYYSQLESRSEEYDELYDLDLIKTKDRKAFTAPTVDRRHIKICNDGKDQNASVQITVKPILSFRHKKDHVDVKEVLGSDPRTELIKKIQSRFIDIGLRHYTARPGGRTSIDVTADWLDKAFALEYLITDLNARGVERDGQKVGSNTLYLGDEVIVGGGNDYPVSRIPGILVIAVNQDSELIPFNSRIYAASKLFDGPNATARILQQFNLVTREAGEKIFASKQRKINGRPLNAVEHFKRSIFIPRILDRINKSTEEDVGVDDIQIIHAIATLLGRRDPTARKWMTVIEKELNEFMEQFALNDNPLPPALGASHEDG